jgi:hypothetical protein
MLFSSDRPFFYALRVKMRLRTAGDRLCAAPAETAAILAVRSNFDPSIKNLTF